MRRSRLKRTTACAALAGWLFTGCGEPAPNLRVSVREWAVTAEPGTADEGQVIVDIDNTGALQHEFVIVRAQDPSALPRTGDGVVDLGQVRIADRLAPIAPGRYRFISPDLQEGTYAVFCNLVTTEADGRTVSHFAQGMASTIRVRPVGPAETQ